MLVSSTANPPKPHVTTDGRRNIVSITPLGTRRLIKLDRLLTDVQDVLLAPLSTGERAQLVRLLTRVVDHHARRDSGTRAT